MAVEIRSHRNSLELTEGARYALWCEKHRIDMRLHPYEMNLSRSFRTKNIYRVIDYGAVSINGLPVAQFYVVYKNDQGSRFACAVYPEPRPPLPHPNIRVWVE